MQSVFNGLARSFAIVALVCLPSLALAVGQQPYDAKAFEAAKGAGKAVLVEIHADWCMECKAQNLVLNKLTTEPTFSNLVRFRVDYDKQKDIVKIFKARKQSTLVLYKGNTEVARTVGETSEQKIRAMLSKAS